MVQVFTQRTVLHPFPLWVSFLLTSIMPAISPFTLFPGVSYQLFAVLFPLPSTLSPIIMVSLDWRLFQACAQFSPLTQLVLPNVGSSSRSFLNSAHLTPQNLFSSDFAPLFPLQRYHPSPWFPLTGGYSKLALSFHL
jgi:hypothetical protein